MKVSLRGPIGAVAISIFFLGCSSQFSTTPQGGSAPSANDTMPGGPALISGTISLDPKLAKKVSPGDVLYVMAKMGEGGPPLAVKKMRAETFPMVFELGANDVMMPGRSLQGNVVLIVRVDKDGMAGPPQPGDLEGKTAKPVKVGSQSVAVKINKAY